MSTKNLPEIVVYNFQGMPLTPRMKSMGVTGMIEGNGGWSASFESYPNLTFALPPPVSDWLLGDLGAYRRGYTDGGITGQESQTIYNPYDPENEPDDYAAWEAGFDAR